MQNIVTLGEINDALKIAAVSAAQLADMGFAALANKPICEGLPPEESRRLRNAKLYPAESIGQIRVALAQRLAAPAATTTPDERKDLVPGVMRCAKCEFQLVRQVLAVNLGEVFAGDSKTEPCPNDCGPLWPVTWKQYAEQAMDAAESMADRAFAAEKEVKQLRGELSALDAPSLRAKVMSTPLGLHGTGIGDIGIAYRAGHRAALLTAADLVASSVVAAPAAVAVPDDRAAFERELIDNHHYVPSDFSFKDGFYGGDDDYIQFGWDVWQARAALAATPAAVQTHAEAAAALGINSALTRIRAGNHAEAIAPLEHALRALAATPAADAPAVPKWIDDPHDIEQGQMLNPEWVRQQQPAIMPKGESAAAQLRAMATNYPTGHSWDKLDAKACIRGALEIEALRALLAQAATAAAPAPPAEGVQAVEQGEVLVTVSGFTGSGKSAIAGEIEILCRALGLQVEWPDGAPEKNLTHADWTEALELYKPRVRIVECNVPHPFVKGQDK